MTDPVELLMIEDNPDDLELTLHVFKQYKLANHIKVVRDGAEALEYLFGDAGLIPACETLPKVILLDLKLPKVDGLEVLSRLKSNPLTKLIPVVVMTSSRENRDLVASYELGVNSYIVKPVDFAQFTEVVRQLGMYWLLFNERPCLPREQPKA